MFNKLKTFLNKIFEPSVKQKTTRSKKQKALNFEKFEESFEPAQIVKIEPKIKKLKAQSKK